MKKQLCSKKKQSDAPIIVQILILAIICFLGEILTIVIPINCSSAVYDFVLVYLVLQFKIIKLEWIEKISDILAKGMLIAFVPGTVSIIESLDEALQMIIPTFLAATLGSVVVLVVSGLTVQGLMNLTKSVKEGEYYVRFYKKQ